eukprot:2539547-Pyramimonas_sp.AAC.1
MRKSALTLTRSVASLCNMYCPRVTNARFVCVVPAPTSTRARARGSIETATARSAYGSYVHRMGASAQTVTQTTTQTVTQTTTQT